MIAAAAARARATRILILLSLVVIAVLGPAASAKVRPEVIPLPNGFQPEGIATKGANTFFAGSIPTGAIYRGDLRTGETSPFVAGQEGRNAIGLSLKGGMLFVAGGETGRAHVYDARSGDELAAFQLTTDPTFVNDVVATRDTAFFTDSVNQRLYTIPILGKGEFGAATTLPLTGDIAFTEGFNANGIDATSNGEWLVLVQSNTGQLFRVDPDTGETSMIDLGGDTVMRGDGLLLEGGRRLWVVQNFDELLTLVRVDAQLSSGVVVDRFTHDSFDVPTTVAKAGNRLALVNARFGNATPETAEYWVSQIRRPR